jgi:hypothetical protein
VKKEKLRDVKSIKVWTGKSFFIYFRIKEVAQCHRLLSKAGCTAQSGDNSFFPVLRIRDVHPGSGFFHPGSASKNLSIFNPKNCF